MAGAGYKLFATGDVLTAAQVNTYLNEQTVMVFADSAARTTALSGVLAEGMMSYLQDTNAVEVYDGTSWTAVGGGGASPLTTKGDLYTFSTVDARLGVGANGTVLTADSAEATGLKWAAPAAGSFVGCRVYNNSAQSTSDGVDTTVNFNQESFDSDGFHDNSTNNSRITIPSGKGGKYLIGASMTFVNNATSGRRMSIKKNGTIISTGEAQQARNIGGTSLSASTLVALVATDYVEIEVNQSSGGSLNVGGSEADANFWAYLVGA